MNNKILSVMFVSFCCLLAGQSVLAGSAPDVLSQPAEQSSKAEKSVLLSIARAGDRLVAVGERGVVLFSDDNGYHWTQSRVPVSTTLTAVQFVDSSQGWAVGHSGVVLHTDNGGESWTVQLDGLRAAELEVAAASSAAGDTSSERRLAAAQRLVDDGADKPFLALNFTDAQNGVVVGAYGMAFQTTDGGSTWTSWMGQLPNPKGLHVYGVAQNGADIYMAGEQGLLIRSKDSGRTFSTLSSPYEGSYFALTVLPTGRLLIAGLRGKLFVSDDGGDSFKTLNSPTPVSFNSLNVSAKQLFLVTQAGALLEADIDSLSPKILPVPPGPPLIALVQAADGNLVGVSFAGPKRLPPLAAATQLNAE